MSLVVPNIPIAIVGVSALFPGSADVAGFWRDIVDGRDRIEPVPPTHWLIEDYYDPDPAARDKTYARRGAFLSAIDFDPMEHGLPPTSARATDTAQLLGLVLAKQVLHDATRGAFPNINRERISVILGATGAQELITQMAARMQRPVWVKALREHGLPEAEVQAICDRMSDSYVPWQESTFPGLLGNVIAGRIANRFDLGGTNCILDAACASSLAAVAMAIDELRLGKSDMAITGGVETLNDIVMFMCFSKTPAISPTEDCRPFSAKGDGTMLGEGVCFLALRRLDDAERDGNHIYAVIHGIGSSSDGRAKSVYAPVAEGQAKAIRRAYEDAGYGPDSVELVEAHGTGTKAGDAAEFSGLRMVFEDPQQHRGGARTDHQWCALGSVKSQLGHTKAAAGAAGLLKAVLSLHHKILPPTIKIDEPNPLLEIENSPFYLSRAARPWISDRAHPRRASVSSFGFGGSNFHVALQEYTGDSSRPPRLRTHPAELLVLAAESAAALVTLCRTTLAELAATHSLALIAYTTQRAFDKARPARLSIVATDEADLRAKLTDAATAIEKAPASAYSTPRGVHYALGALPGELAFLFPGQGSQYVGMGADVAMAFTAARATWERAAELHFDGTRLDRVVFPPPVFGEAAHAAQNERLTSTKWAQPAIGVVSAALMAVLRSLRIKPAMVGGHSFGEVTALHAAGAFDESALVAIARRRGELMAAAAADRPGGMIALAQSIDEARALIARLGLDLVVANHNAPKQVVLSGELLAIESAMAKLATAGVNAKQLSVATAFHSPVVASSSAPFRQLLDEVTITAPTLPVMANAHAAPYPRDPAAVRELLAEQIARPVRFVEAITAMYAAGARTFVEVGPSSVLTQLVTDILLGEPHRAVALDRKGQHGVTALWGALGQLAVAGVEIDFAPLWVDYAPPVDPRTLKKPALTLSITGTNYGKPYPPAGGAAALPKPNPPRPAAAPALATPAPSAAPVRSVESPAPVQRASVPPVAARPPAPPATSREPSAAWITAYQEMQRQTADAHAAYLKAMADSHNGFLKTAEASLSALGGLVSGVAEAPAVVAPAMVAAAAPQAYALPVARVEAPAPKVTPPAPAPVAQTAAPVALAPQAAPARDLKALLLTVVADKTGYPAEMLGMDMALEADLGIDSIKRVEILAAMKEQAPDLPAVAASEMAALRTLGQIVSSLESRSPAPAATTAAPAAVAAQAAPARDLKALLLTVVADKTGYPAEMLGMDMALEADLGIDSIKRVEILAAMKEQAPDLPAVAASEMAALRTLGQIVSSLGGSAAGQQSVSSSAVTAPMAPAPAVASPEKREPSPTRFVLREVVAPAAGLAVSGLWEVPEFAVVDDGGGIAGALVERLVHRGLFARVVAQVPDAARGVIFLGGLREVRSIEDASAINAEAFAAARTVARNLSAGSGIFVTVQDTGGDFGLSGSEPLRAWSAGLAGLAKTAAQEWPKATVRAIDLQRGGRLPAALAEALTDELFLGAPQLEVGLHADGRRTTLQSYPQRVAASSAALASVVNERSVVIASGGARGVTAATLIELARAARPKLALLGRTELAEESAVVRSAKDESAVSRALMEAAKAAGKALLPLELRAAVREVMAGREIRATLDAIAATGAEAIYVSVDVKDVAALTTALDKVRHRFGPITGLVHGAGLLADKLLVDKTAEHFQTVFATKVGGLQAMLAATAADPIRFLCLFSSIAGRTGNAGQSDYAMANEVLNKVAAAEAQRRGASCVVRSLGWGPWESGMVTPALRAKFAELGVPLISLAAGARMMLDELSSTDASDVELVLGCEPRAEALVSSGTTPEITADVLVNARTYPFLDSHRIAGSPVVPLVLVLEWFVRTVCAVHPGRVLGEWRELKVRRGIRLSRYDGDGERFRIVCKLAAGGAEPTYHLELRGADGALHYTATATLHAHPPTPKKAPPRPATTAAAPWTPAELYPKLLFHGPALQVIRELGAVTAQGTEAVIAGVRAQGWADGSWATDVAALDGGLQLARLWGIHNLGKPSLPTQLGAFVRYRDDVASGPLRCVLTARSISELRTVCDLTLVDAADQVTAELRDVEMHVLSSAD